MLAVAEGLFLNGSDARRNRHAFDLAVHEPSLADALDTIRDGHVLPPSEVPQELISHHHFCGKHYNIVCYISLDVEREALFHPDYLEVETIIECIDVYLRERAGQRDFLNPAVSEALFSDALHAARNLNAPEIFATVECPVLYSLQRGGKPDAL